MSKCCVVPLESTWCTIIRKHWYASTRQTRNSIRQQYDQSPLFSSAVWDKPSGLISREGWWGHPSRIGSEWSFLQPWWIIPLFCDVGSWDELTRFLVTARTAVGVGGWCLPSFSPLLSVFLGEAYNNYERRSKARLLAILPLTWTRG